MYNRSKGSLGFNIWTVFSDVAFGFMIIILLLFMRSLANLNEFASYAKAAMNDRKEIQKDLKENGLLNTDGSGDDEGKTMLTDKIVWPENEFKINKLEQEAQDLIVKFGGVLKVFLDKPDTKKKDKFRYQTYTIIIIGHANTNGITDYNYNLSKDRAESIRKYLFETVFKDKKGEDNKNKYKILATGYGDKHLITRQNPEIGDRCIEIAFKYDEMDMIKGEK